ncbi:MAG: PAS domain S-box protein [Trueperaceae bacterium]
MGIDSAGTALLILDDRHHCVYLNRAAEKLTGYKLREFEGRTLHELIHHVRPDGKPYPESACPIHLALEQEVRAKGEDILVRKDGTFYPVAYAVTPFRHEGEAVGAVVEVHATAHATAGEKQFSESLPRERADFYQALLNSMDQGFFVCDIILDDIGKPIDYRFIEMNSSFEELTGLKDASGKTARELVPDLEPHWFEIYGRVALTGEPVRVSEGSAAMGRWFDVHAFRIGDAGSLRVAALFTNVTERKRAEEERDRLVKALRLERSRLQTVFQEAPAAIATLRGSEHVFEMANPLYYQLVGKRELIGKTARQAFPELQDEGIFELLDRVYETGEPFVARGMRVPLKHESQVEQHDYYLDFVYQPLREADGSVSGIFAHAVDVTEHKKAVDALGRAHDLMGERVEERTAELKALNSELESFNYSVSHDLRAPLRGIDGFSQALLEEYEKSLDDGGRSYLRRIRAAAGRMGELIDDLLKLSYLTRTEVTPSEFDLGDVARQVAKDLLDREPEGVGLTITIEDGMTAVGDPSLLRIALENLLDNAIKFTRGRTDGRIEVGMSGDATQKHFIVRDNGAGFSMDHSQRLFVPFQRLHASAEYSGTGIGLATVQRIIHKHGGRIWADGEVDKGATFYFTLSPRARRSRRSS